MENSSFFRKLLLHMGTIHCLAFLLPAALGLGSADADPAIGTLYGTDGGPVNLYTVDPATGAGTFIGLTGFSPGSDLTKLP